MKELLGVSRDTNIMWLKYSRASVHLLCSFHVSFKSCDERAYFRFASERAPVAFQRIHCIYIRRCALTSVSGFEVRIYFFRVTSKLEAEAIIYKCVALRIFTHSSLPSNDLGHLSHDSFMIIRTTKSEEGANLFAKI